ncbi:MAG: hypothetical protein JWQ90_2392 [Hydrocarboniphaga sp.]|uniref:DUF3237 domain-containing protein n=1 Tax=Hydrocarboniphaga sp. TaxID=2033016 RepID=UPI0026290544|nr:DUF3237 domain-containing protein [Hydrocarboniphaga sp.]MDB5969942.1 hypothetical protein [Hydrocarboniphaga sp.]
MKLEPLFRMRVDLGKRHVIGQTPKGTRTVWALAGGEASGPGLQATVVPVGGEFELVDSDGCYHLDVRLVLRTHDGANIFVQYFGVAERNAESDRLIGLGTPGDFGTQHFFTQPRFESGGDAYRWLNRVVAVGEGRMLARSVEYRVYQCIASKSGTPGSVSPF